MAKQNKTTLKGYFETGDIPSQAQYADLIDSQLNLAETGIQTAAGEITVDGNLSSSNIISSNHITASGNISASGTIVADQYNVDGHLALNTDGSVQGRVFPAPGITNIQIGRQGSTNRNIELLGPITASGNISASGIITALSMSGDGSNLTGVIAAASAGTYSSSLQTLGNITSSGNISASGIITALSMSGDGSNLTGITATLATTASNVTVNLSDSIDLGVIPLLSNSTTNPSPLFAPTIQLFYDQETTLLGDTVAAFRIGQSNPVDRPGAIYLFGGPTATNYITTFNSHLKITPGSALGNKNLILSASGTGNITLEGSVTQSGGTVKIDYDSLPTSDPNDKGQVYRNGSNALFVSAG